MGYTDRSAKAGIKHMKSTKPTAIKPRPIQPSHPGNPPADQHGPPSNPERKVRCRFTIDPEVDAAGRRAAHKAGMSMSAFVEMMIHAEHAKLMAAS